MRSVKVARWATFVYFGLNGFVMGTWIVHIPAVEHRLSAAVPRRIWAWPLSP